MAEGYRQLPPLPLGIQAGPAAPPAAVVGGFRSLLVFWVGGASAGAAAPAAGGTRLEWRSSQAWHRSYST